MSGKAIIFSAPSGSGKSTLVNHLLKKDFNLAFSISATSRQPRGSERDGTEYFFLTEKEFRDKIAEDAFIEYEEVYPGKFYGTLKSEVETRLAEGQNLVFDVDVVGGINIKRYFGSRAMALFIQPPSVEELRKRLNSRATDSPEIIEQRISKAEWELQFAPKFDKVIINDNLDAAISEAERVIDEFLSGR
jgi:guanylate kinase